jgi:DNA polymerase iota
VKSPPATRLSIRPRLPSFFLVIFFTKHSFSDYTDYHEPVDMQRARGLHRNDERLIIHFDYDCFYASVVENENPALKSVPLAIQQKQIVVTCNYEARRRGLRKLQLITEAKKVCPEVVIVLGEDLTRFRDASKDLYNFLRESIWSGRAERLGFDEVWYAHPPKDLALC